MDSSLWTRLTLPSSERLDHERALDVMERCKKHLKSLKITTARKGCVTLANNALLNCPKLRSLKIKISDSDDLENLRLEIGGSLRYLKLSGTLKPELLDSKAHCLKNLTHFRLIGAGLTDDGLKSMADHCKQLEWVDIATVSMDAGTISYFLDKVQNRLKYIYFSCDQIDKTTLVDVRFQNLQKCQQLEKFGINGRTFLDDLNIIGTLKKLKALHLANCRWVHQSTGLDFGGLTSVDFVQGLSSQKWNHLTAFSAWKWDGIDELSLKAIADNCPELVKICLGGCSGVSDAGLKHLLIKCSKLSELSLQGAVDITIEAFRDSRAPLRRLYLCKETVDAVGLAFISEIKGTLPGLRFFELERWTGAL